MIPSYFRKGVSLFRGVLISAIGLAGCILLVNSCKDMGNSIADSPAIQGFRASMPVVDLGPGQFVEVAISGGHPPYVLLTLHDPNLVSATLSNSNTDPATLALSAASSIVTDATTTVHIRDSHDDDSPTHDGDTVTVEIHLHTVLIPIATPNAVTVGRSTTVDVLINGGTLPYQIVNPPNPAYASASFENVNVNPATLHITGVSVASVSGSTFVKVKGSASSQVDTVRIQITKTP